MKKKVIISIVAILLVVCIVAGAITVMNFRKPKKDNENLMPLSEKVKIGDYVSYNAGEGNTYTSLESKNGKKDQTFTTTGNEKWRVLSIEDDGSINLISESPIRTDDGKAYLIDGAKGYANAQSELNNISKIFASGQNGVSARSMNYEDIIKLIGIDKISEVYGVDFFEYQTEEEKIEKAFEILAKQNGTQNNVNYGTEFEITNSENGYIPDKESAYGYSKKNDYKFTDSYIYFTYTQRNNLLSEDLCSLLYGTENQMTGWIATPYQKALVERNIDSDTTYVEYGIYFTISDLNNYTNCNISPYQIYFSNNQLPSSGSDSGCGIRPVVTISNNTHYISGEGTLESPYEIDGEVKEKTDFSQNETTENILSNSDNINNVNNENISNTSNVVNETENNLVSENNVSKENSSNKENMEDDLYEGTLKVGNYSLKYGTYKTTTAQFTDDRGVVDYEITITLRNDGKYILKSSDNEILKDSSGTYEILDNVNGLTNVIKLSDDLFYTVTANNSFSLPAGSGAVFNYTGK